MLIVMSEVYASRGGRERGRETEWESASPETLRIRIDVALGTPYQEIREEILRQAYEMAGTQLRAAVALGITPDTISRVMRRSERRRMGAAEAAFGSAGQSETPLFRARPAELLARAVGQVGRARDGEQRSERKLFTAEKLFAEEPDNNLSLDGADQEAVWRED